MPNGLSIGYMGSGKFAARCLELVSARIKPRWVVTNAPKAAGRGMKMQDTPVFAISKELGLDVFTTEKLSADTERIEWIKNNLPDVILVIDFGHIIKEPLLSMPRLGCINIHPSKLPLLRGSAPVQRAVMQGMRETAVSIFRLDAGMDSGPVLAQPPVIISESDTVTDLYEKAASTGAAALLALLCDTPEAQWIYSTQDDAKATYAPKIEKEEGRIDWNKSSAELTNLIRGIGSAPGVFCTVNGKRLRIHEAASSSQRHGMPGTVFFTDGLPAVSCEEGSLVLKEVQPEGKKRQPAADWARGSRLSAGDSLL